MGTTLRAILIVGVKGSNTVGKKMKRLISVWLILGLFAVVMGLGCSGSGSRMLVTGGRGTAPTQFLQSAEIYNHNSRGFTSASNMATPRLDHTATALGNGKVLIVGGKPVQWGDPIGYAEIYDTNSNTFTLLWGTERTAHTATLMSNGRVLIAGGIDRNLNKMDSAVEYVVRTGTFEPVPAPTLLEGLGGFYMNPARLPHRNALI